MKDGSPPAGDVPPLAADDLEWLFVYGTLKSGGGMERLMSGCVRTGSATLHGSLYDVGRFPALVLDGAGPVSGELWRCPPETLRELDSYEGVHDGLFRRVRAFAGAVECWTYVAGPSLAPRLTASSRIAEGSWFRSGAGEGT